jgi:uncharacterized repeat protein (TIGR01451 family)
MAPGASVVVNANVTIPPSATSWSNTATATTDSVDPNTANNSDTVTTTITQSADVSVAKTGDATVVAGNDVTYTITVTNNGPSDASNVVLTDTLPRARRSCRRRAARIRARSAPSLRGIGHGHDRVNVSPVTTGTMRTPPP